MLRRVTCPPSTSLDYARDKSLRTRPFGNTDYESQAGLRSQDGGVYVSYGAAKAGVIAYTRYLTQEPGPHNITVNCIAPAFVSTGRLEALSFSRPGARDRTAAQVPPGRLATPDDIAKVMEFFVTDLGDYVTGQCLSVCGGVIRF